MSSTDKKRAYLFPGQGAQYVGMGKSLYDAFPAAREVFDSACDILKMDLRGLCFNGPQETLATTSNSQPAILTTSIAALRAYESVHKSAQPPAFVAGLSLGEYTALVAAGAISFADGVRLVRSRGLFMEDASRQNPGTMAAVMGAELDVVEEVCRATHCEVANLNAPGQIVVSGSLEDIQRAISALQTRGAKRCMVLDVSGPFHCSRMEPARARLAGQLAATPIGAPAVPVVSNVDALPHTDPAVIGANLLTQLVQRTLWNRCMTYLVSEGVTECFEIGPGSVLKGLAKRVTPPVSVISIDTAEQLRALVL